MDKDKEVKVTWSVSGGIKFGFGFGCGIFLWVVISFIIFAFIIYGMLGGGMMNGFGF